MLLLLLLLLLLLIAVRHNDRKHDTSSDGKDDDYDDDDDDDDDSFAPISVLSAYRGCDVHFAHKAGRSLYRSPYCHRCSCRGRCSCSFFVVVMVPSFSSIGTS